MERPKKTREMQSEILDSTIWNDFAFRDDDVVIATYSKAGTTWMQQIVGQLIFNGSEDIVIGELSPWLDMVVPPREVKLAMLEAQTHRRFVKTHLPVDALVFSPTAKYIYIGRDGRDMVWSLYDNELKTKKIWLDTMHAASSPGAPAHQQETLTATAYFRRWLERDGFPIFSLWENVRSWWSIRDLPNVLLVHFNALKADLAGEMRRIGQFLDCPIDESRWDAIVEHCTFAYMKSHAANSAPFGGALWEGGAPSFFHRGTNDRWRGVLEEADIRAYEARALEELGPDCAHWLATGH